MRKAWNAILDSFGTALGGLTAFLIVLLVLLSCNASKELWFDSVFMMSAFVFGGVIVGVFDLTHKKYANKPAQERPWLFR